jgi:hypothetical protein
MRNHWREITAVAGGQSCLSTNGHGSDAAIRVGPGASSGAVEEFRRLLCIHPFKPDGVGKKASSKDFS